MDKLKGSGNTFSTSGQPWKPFRFSPKIARQKARAARIRQFMPQTKAEARQACDQAAKEWRDLVGSCK